MQTQYLEIVTLDVDAACSACAAAMSAEFGEPVAELGGARVANMPGDAMVGIRAPMHDAEAAGSELAHPAMEIPGYGTFAISILGDVHHGIWQLRE